MLKMSLKNFMLLVLSVSLVIGVILMGGCVDGETATLEAPTQIIENVTPIFIRKLSGMSLTI